MCRKIRKEVDPNLSTYPFLKEWGLSILFSKAGDRNKGKKSEALKGLKFPPFLLQSASGEGLWKSFAIGNAAFPWGRPSGGSPPHWGEGSRVQAHGLALLELLP